MRERMAHLVLKFPISLVFNAHGELEWRVILSKTVLNCVAQEGEPVGGIWV